MSFASTLQWNRNCVLSSVPNSAASLNSFGIAITPSLKIKL